VSTNLIDPARTPLWRVAAEIERLAAEHGVGVRESELVGLVPARTAAVAAARSLLLPAMEPDRILEVAVAGEFGAEVLPR